MQREARHDALVCLTIKAIKGSIFIPAARFSRYRGVYPFGLPAKKNILDPNYAKFLSRVFICARRPFTKRGIQIDVDPGIQRNHLFWRGTRRSAGILHSPDEKENGAFESNPASNVVKI